MTHLFIFYRLYMFSSIQKEEGMSVISMNQAITESRIFLKKNDWKTKRKSQIFWKIGKYTNSRIPRKPFLLDITGRFRLPMGGIPLENRDDASQLIVQGCSKRFNNFPTSNVINKRDLTCVKISNSAEKSLTVT